MPNENLPIIEKILASAVGSGVSLMFIPGNWKRKLFLFLGGFAVAWYVGPAVSVWVEMNESATGFLLGFISMAAADGVFRAWYALDLKAIATSWLQRRK